MKSKLAITVLLLFTVFLAACVIINTSPPQAEPPKPPETTTPPATPPSTTPPATTPPATTPPVAKPPLFKLPPFLFMPVAFENKDWVLESYGLSGSPQPPIAGKEVTIKFDSAVGKCGGSGGCNSYSGSYVKNSDKLTVTGIISTMMACPFPAGIMTQESKYLDALKNAESFKSALNKLTINCSGNRVLIFIPK